MNTNAIPHPAPRHAAITACPACGRTAPEDSLLCFCGARQRSPSTRRPTHVGRLVASLRHLAESIGWHSSGDGCIHMASAQCIEVSICVLPDGRHYVNAVDHLLDQVVREYTGTLTLAQEQRAIAEACIQHVLKYHGNALEEPPAPSPGRRRKEPELDDLHIGGSIELPCATPDELHRVKLAARREIERSCPTGTIRRKKYRVAQEGLVVRITRIA